MEQMPKEAIYKFYELEALRSTGRENWLKINDYLNEGKVEESELKRLIRLHKSLNNNYYKVIESLRCKTVQQEVPTQQEQQSAN